MKERIQKRGHCQGCGRMQAANPGLAHHGYTVEHGFFNGTCFGAKQLPLELSRELLDAGRVSMAVQADRLEDRALKLEQREIDPEGRLEEKWAPGAAGNRRGYIKVLTPYAELGEHAKKEARRAAVWACESEAKAIRQWIEDMGKLADKVHGQPLTEVKVGDQSKVINVGDTVKVCGEEVVVTKIAEKQARGVGPYLNGKYMDHVFWEQDGKERSYPKRYARKVVSNG